ELCVLGFLDVADPLVVGVERVDADGDGLHPALVELGLELRGVAELGGADGRAVLGVGEQYHPVASGPFVEPDRSQGGFLREIGGNVAQAKGSQVCLRKWSDVVG